MTENAQVAIFIDYDNIEISVSDVLGKNTDVDWSEILETATRIGRIALRRAYADWAIYPDRQRELLGRGIELVHVSSKRGKNAADIRIVMDALEMIHRGTSITHVMLISGDGDFTELVHRLRVEGKTVIGMGVSGTSAEYLVNACDEFIYYDKLVAPPPAPKPAKPARNGKEGKDEPTPEPVVTFDISEARQLLRKVLQSEEQEWMLAAGLKQVMLRLNPAFNERNYNFKSFKEFLAAQTDIVEVRLNDNQQIEARLEEESEQVASQVPDALLDRYLQILASQKIRMTPNEFRPAIVFKFHEFLKSTPDLTLTQLKDRVQAHFETNAPHVKMQYIAETAHQLFHTYCFIFDQEETNYEADVRLWDKNVSLGPEIGRATDLLDKCDKGLLQKLGKALGSTEKINKEVAARLLYGSFRGQRMLEHVAHLLAGLKEKK
ncbi:MAG: NYN domain-containing protein [Anaerolineae bacterium]|nr:NYN domain-containing protein [Anaerolineae bacterium]